MTHQAGLVPIQTSQSFTAQSIPQLLSASYFFQLTDRERERESFESQANILIFHMPTQWRGTCFDTSQRKKRKKHFHRQFPSHTGITKSTVEDRGKLLCGEKE